MTFRDRDYRDIQEMPCSTGPLPDVTSNRNISVDSPEITNIGRILSVKDGVAFVSGLVDIKVGEMV